MGVHIANDTAGAALPQRKETRWMVSCAEIHHCFDPHQPKSGLPKGQQSLTGGSSAAESQHMMTSDRRNITSLCKVSWYHAPKLHEGGQEEDISQVTLGQFSCDFVVFQ